jgi:DNA-binding response OmpR family regulator
MQSVLFVSHDGSLRAVAARALGRAGFHVKTVEHGGHALLALVERGRFETLVIEDDLPEGPGDRIAARMRRHCPDLHVVRMCDRAERLATAKAGIAVVRPFTADDLIDAIQALRRTISR